MEMLRSIRYEVNTINNFVCYESEYSEKSKIK